MTMSTPQHKRAVFSVLIVCFAISAAQASSFTISPTRINLSKKQQAVTVRLLNTGDDPVTVQAHVVAWSQNGNEENYKDTDDLLLNPPIFKLEPGKPQLMRLGLRQPRSEENEISYRLIVEEVPPPPEKNERVLRTILRISVPVFIAPQSDASKRLEWRAETTGAGGFKLIATNRGNTHVEVLKLGLQPDGDKTVPVNKSTFQYLLPGQTREWVFDDQSLKGAATVTLTAKTDGGDYHESLAPSVH